MDEITKLTKNIGKRLLRLRKDKKKTQDAVINDIGEEKISLRSLKSYENGKTLIDLTKLIYLADYYGSSLDYLIRGKDVIDLDDYSWVNTFRMLGRLMSSLVLFPEKIEDEKDVYYGCYNFLTLDPATVVYVGKCLNNLSIATLFGDDKTKQKQIAKIFDECVEIFKDLPGNVEMNEERLGTITKFLRVKDSKHK